MLKKQLVRLSIVGLIGLASGFVGCSGYFNNEPELNVTGSGFDSTAPVTINFPASGADLNGPSIPIGAYNLISFQASITDPSTGNSASLQRTNYTHGQINQADSLSLAASFISGDSTNVTRLDLQLNVPCGILVADNSANLNIPRAQFVSTVYYWQDWASDNSWQWRSFANLSGAGADLFEIFANATNTPSQGTGNAPVNAPNGIYENNNVPMNTLAQGTMMGQGTASTSSSGSNYQITTYFQLKNYPSPPVGSTVPGTQTVLVQLVYSNQ